MENPERQILYVNTGCLILIFLFALCWLPTLSLEATENEEASSETANAAETAAPNTKSSGRTICAEETTASTMVQETWEISAADSADGKQKFQFTLEDYIEKYNLIYRTEHSGNWLLPAEKWYRFDGQESPFSGMETTRYEFDPDKNVHNDPDMWVYIASEDGNICEISLGMPEHDWTQWRYEVFQEQCYYTLSVFYPELTAEEVWTLFDLLHADAAANEYISFSEKPEPAAIRYRGDVGCYGFIHGGVIRINVIPVTSYLLESFTAEGGLTYGI